MGILNIDDLKDGMALADDIINKHGNILIKKGNILSEQNIMLLKAWGVTEVNVQGVDQTQADQEEFKALPEEVIDSIEQKLKKCFPHFENNLVMEEVFRVVKKLRIKQALKQMNGEANG